MLDLPNAKRVRRNEINSYSPSNEPSDLDPDLETRVQEQLGNIYKNNIEGALSNNEPQKEDAVPSSNNPPDAEEESYEFRLFSTSSAHPSNSKPPHDIPQRIVLRSPTPADPGFIIPCRPEQYYFTGPPTPQKLAQYRTAAITGEEILAGLNVHWQGSELPWRVTIIKSTHHRNPLETTQATNTITGKRKKSGKKRRIAIRKKVAAKLAKDLAKRQSRAEKEATEREKRTRRNREKKVKRKGKEKAKKAEALGGHS